MPFFSVIIPLYNKEKYIEDTLNCVLAQTFQDFEVLIIDDGSTDNSVAFVSKFTDARITLLQQENGGVSSARNLGINHASGTLIGFLDADDYWYPNHLEQLAGLYNDFPIVGLYCSRYKIRFSENNDYTPKLLDIGADFRGMVPDFFHSSSVDRIAWTSAVAVPKAVINEIGAFSKEVSNGQDLELWIRIAIKYPVAITDSCTSLYHFEVSDSLAKRSILRKSLPNLEQFSGFEQKNPSLKRFLDLYRIEYALHFHIFGNAAKRDFYLKEVSQSALAMKTRILFALPPFVLRRLLSAKRWLNKIGINFTVYH